MARIQPKDVKTNGREDLRSPCPVACALDIVGDRWTLLVVRDLMLGRSRFKDFSASPEGIPTNILSERLSRLIRHGLAEQVPADDGSLRLGYRLTEKGRALGPVLSAMRDWGLEWQPGTQALMMHSDSRILDDGQVRASRRGPAGRNIPSLPDGG